MSKIAYHKKKKSDYVQYTCRIKSDILEAIKEIAQAEDISINECINQSLQYAIDDYQKNGK